jgi:hypothetical protein
MLPKNGGLIPHMRFGPGCQVPVCIYPYVYRGAVGATVSSHGYLVALCKHLAPRPKKRSDTIPCSALLITLVIACACGGCVPSKPSPSRCPVWSPAIRLIWTLRFKPPFLYMHSRDRRSQNMCCFKHIHRTASGWFSRPAP